MEAQKSYDYVQSIDWNKIKKLIKILLITVGTSIILFQLIQKLPKNILKLPILQKPKVKTVFNSYEQIFYVDPVHVIQQINDPAKDFLLIDTRSKQEFENGHIRGSVNVPLYSDYRKTEESKVVLSEYKKQINKVNTEKKVIIMYGYYSRSQLLLESVNYLMRSGVRVQLLSVSWYEFKNNPSLWLPGNDLGVVDINQYLEGSMYQNNL